ncbi:MAG: hypothetical protein IJ390_04525 [Lachnospiraceae bacterium]|nr:hypothetical protein [Lachnospiraceae bacterium]
MAAKGMDDIAALLKGIHFRKKLFGGVDEADVWKQLDMLQKEYRQAFEAQEEQYRALLSERNAMITKLKKQLQGFEGERHA